MNRTGLIIALVLAAVNGLIFGFFPDLELRVAQHFHDVIDPQGNAFAWRV
jgi:lipid A 4'-phosphatase